MKKLSLLLLFILPISCAQKESTPEPPAQTQTVTDYENITVSEFNAEYTQPDSDVVILDVRTDEEVSEGMIPNAIQIDFRGADFKTKIAELDTDKTYVVYCRSGGRSSAASEIMTKELGFKDVKNLEGGYTAWSEND
ncbi:MAG: rhodanese-like domain-containing protein [Balneola sp.]